MNGKSPHRTSSLRLGIVGCGRIVERGYLPALRELPGVTLVGVADPDRARAQLLARSGGTLAYNSATQLITAGNLDAVVVATPADRHLEVATQAAAAGLPSLVEKPPATDLDGALGLAALAPSPAIGFNRRFLQGLELRPVLPLSGWLELELEMRFRRDGWSAHVSRDEALLDAGTHLIDLAIFLAGSEPIAVRGAVVEPERASLELELGRGRARIRCATDRPYAERVEVRDRAGQVLGACRTNRLRARVDRLRRGPDPLVRSLRRQIECFASALLHPAVPLPDIARQRNSGALATAADGIATMAVVEAARSSAALGGAEVTVAVPEGVA
ncbi:MAG TPA: Gfo/Idh/MocA family oxidoreductase [Solirubrobacterales bacterium]|nr:Gfo/Idh/MocA family oxidoreductase [Solirubrobacterales bacterium]